MLSAKKIIEVLDLAPLDIEGGYFRQSYVSNEFLSRSALPERYQGERPFSSVIYYLLTKEKDSFSALHRLKSDETWHFYLGSPVELLLLYPDGGGETVTMGQDILGGEAVQYTVLRNVWQGAVLKKGGDWALLGTTVAPSYDPSDFTLGEREELGRKYPDFIGAVRKLTRRNESGSTST